jgi:hypothetical protein
MMAALMPMMGQMLSGSGGSNGGAMTLSDIMGESSESESSNPAEAITMRIINSLSIPELFALVAGNW